MRLIDANILIYAHDESSEFHSRAKNYLKEIYQKDAKVLIPDVSFLAFIRITTNHRVMEIPLEPKEAIRCMDVLLSHGKTLVPTRGKNHWQNFTRLVESSGARGPLITDAHIAALALDHDAIVCSHDTDFLKFKEVRFENPFN